MKLTGKTQAQVDADKLKSAEEEARNKRDKLIKDSDWTQLADISDKIDKQAWRVYRQKLRDITKQAGWPLDIQWPVEP